MPNLEIEAGTTSARGVEEVGEKEEEKNLPGFVLGRERRDGGVGNAGGLRPREMFGLSPV